MQLTREQKYERRLFTRLLDFIIEESRKKQRDDKYAFSVLIEVSKYLEQKGIIDDAESKAWASIGIYNRRMERLKREIGR